MRLTITEIEEVKDLMLMKLDTYRSRALDVVESCRHPYNLYEIALKITNFKDYKELREVPIEELRIVLKVSLGIYYNEMLKDITEADHPQFLVEVSEKLDRLLG